MGAIDRRRIRNTDARDRMTADERDPDLFRSEHGPHDLIDRLEPVRQLLLEATLLQVRDHVGDAEPLVIHDPVARLQETGPRGRDPLDREEWMVGPVARHHGGDIDGHRPVRLFILRAAAHGNCYMGKYSHWITNFSVMGWFLFFPRHQAHFISRDMAVLMTFQRNNVGEIEEISREMRTL